MPKKFLEYPGNESYLGEVYLSPELANDAKAAVAKVRVVHISDTHMLHTTDSLDALNAAIPDGDILIHSGDFSDKRYMKRTQRGNMEVIAEFNEWLSALPHKHKVVVAGNHETVFAGLSAAEINEALSAAHYLQESSVRLFGIEIYGVPHTDSNPKKSHFCATAKELKSKWKAIPSTTDILVTHMPPLNVLDLAWNPKCGYVEHCAHCGRSHVKYEHWGSPTLLSQVLGRVQPMVHLFGHVHDDNGAQREGNVLFVNSAMDLGETAHCFDVLTADGSSSAALRQPHEDHCCGYCVLL